jgi:opacity protein-like surface antigen
MLKSIRHLIVSALAAGSLAAFASAASAATCVNKAGEGTNTTEEGAKFQAYEAILQATDWGMWASWMASSQKVGEAPGYKVSKVRFKCTKGGLGSTCVGQATLCK